MKLAMLVVALGIGCFLGNAAYAQGKNDDLKTRVFGWGSILPPKGNVSTSAKAAQNVSYSPARKKTAEMFASWIRKTYTPIGGLPEPWYDMLPEKRTSTEQVPLTYGIAMLLWRPAHAGGDKITRAQPASNAPIAIFANQIAGMEPASWFNTPSQYYFTMDVDRDGNAVDAANQAKFAPLVDDVRSKIGGDYLVYVTGGSYINVVLIPGNKLPVVPVTMGEALQVAEVGCKRANAAGGNPKDLLAGQLKDIQYLREKYTGRLMEPVLIRQIQFGIYCFDRNDNVFEEGATRYPIYKVAPDTYAKCRTDNPQWITIRFPMSREGDARDTAIYKAMTEHFNYAYVYDYFFNPRKVQGKPYQPR